MIVRLADAAAYGRSLIGAKAANLATLAATGLLVPDGFVVPVDADPSPDEVRRAVGHLGAGRFAVRSSAVAEDLPEASYAGLYETFLNVTPGEVADAAQRCRASAGAGRVAAYHHGDAGRGVAVLVQRMVDADAAGVAFTADPVTGARDEVLITAVRGLGESLVSGQAVGEEWIVRRGHVELTRPGEVLEPEQARAIAGLARRVQDLLGGPQDIEWAIEAGRVHLLQARPMTALPEPVTWQPPGGGLWLRNFRIGEWLPDPVTPLFADWLLPRMDEGFREGMRDTAGVAVPFHYGVVNGWYYTRPTPSLRHVPAAVLRSRGRLPAFMVNALVRPGRDPAAADRALLGRLYRRWHDDLLPAYRDLAGRRADGLPAPELIELVDQIARTAGRHLWYLAVVGGAAWKMETCLARFLARRRLTGVSAQTLLSGLPGADRSVPAHAVYSLDWYHPTAAESGLPGAGAGPCGQAELENRRVRGERDYRDQLTGRPRLLAAFTTMTETAQRYAVIRERQARELTVGWPLLRECARRIGQLLTDDGVLEEPDEVFFLTRSEIGQSGPHGAVARQRRIAWEGQRRLAAPLTIGTPPPVIGRHLLRTLGLTRAGRTADTLTGQGASAGRATGPVRVIHGAEDFGDVRPGDVLVARATAPAWTPLFATVTAVVTDGGTLAAHASLIAREYGIPAVVATGDATLRLRDGQIVTVDGTQGIVHL
ncbi:PEP/pyruvate-binding domain-containing protein [Sphaerisporangium perillae]|uniref:PEP/pyruvate-binding domain-containing protein n=1 Tax=Sphaerisporangium perillae TaxID=2935860 RepID=UPI002010A85E|nr:PEP/pyruvate-binding domain-containing protein [Sphaerisporangium perillae]